MLLLVVDVGGAAIGDCVSDTHSESVFCVLSLLLLLAMQATMFGRVGQNAVRTRFCSFYFAVALEGCVVSNFREGVEIEVGGGGGGDRGLQAWR